MAGDGEGCTALFEVKVVGAETKEQAKILAKSVICSSLTKAAIFGHDANWGRILCAMGYSGAQFDPEKVDLYFESAAGKMQIIKDGEMCIRDSLLPGRLLPRRSAPGYWSGTRYPQLSL